ncbi:MAG: acetylornithine aminotransferase [Bogoriella megaspora]|nr:MAG: acetylornithine aminotransferase [Bogoriella megaspora]
MASRLASRWSATASSAQQPAIISRRYTSVASATAASSLPGDFKHAIEKAASLATPDPPSDSPTARLVADQTPYMVPTYIRPPPMFHKGEGCYLWDVENRRYLDFTAGIAVNGLGHCDPGVSNAIAQQARTLIHSSNLYYNPWTGSLSKLLVDLTRSSGAMLSAARAFICNSGSEANEAAIKFARKIGSQISPPKDTSSIDPIASTADTAGSRKHEILSFHNSFHGRTLGSLSATPNPKYQRPFAPMLPGFRYGIFNDIGSVSSFITENTCSVIVEPIQGEGGINVATPEFLMALRKRCDEVGALLIYDEIQCGLGRTGTLWAHGPENGIPVEAQPDVLTTAKALGNGFPIGATLVSEKVSQGIVTGDHGTTFGGNPLACRVAHYVLSRLSDPELQRAVRDKEALFRHHFHTLQKRFPKVVKEVRGKGLILGLQLSADPTPVVTACRERGLLIITAGVNTLRFVPPLVIEQQEIEEGMRILEEAMSVVFEVEGPSNIEGTDGQQEMRAR